MLPNDIMNEYSSNKYIPDCLPGGKLEAMEGAPAVS